MNDYTNSITWESAPCVPCGGTGKQLLAPRGVLGFYQCKSCNGSGVQRPGPAALPTPDFVAGQRVVSLAAHNRGRRGVVTSVYNHYAPSAREVWVRWLGNDFSEGVRPATIQDEDAYRAAQNAGGR